MLVNQEGGSLFDAKSVQGVKWVGFSFVAAILICQSGRCHNGCLRSGKAAVQIHNSWVACKLWRTRENRSMNMIIYVVPIADAKQKPTVNLGVEQPQLL